MLRHIFLLLSISSLVFSQKGEVLLSVTNPIDLNRSSEIILFNLESLYQNHPELRGKFLSVFENNKALLIQSIDNNSDGVDDEIAFQLSFKPKEKKILSIRSVEKKTKTSQSLVDGRFVLPREDFAWENDRVAFRVYGSPVAGDVKNGIDVWTKRVRYPIIGKWYAGEEQVPKIVYHEDHGEGADFFSVGRSLGCGSAGFLWNGKLYQAGFFSFYKIITNGPLRISFELYYPDIQIDSMKFMEVKRITLDVGEQLNKIEEYFIPEIPGTPLTLVAGLVKRKKTSLKRSADNQWMELWGLTNDDSVNQYLGTAVVFTKAHNIVPTEDSLHYLLSATLDPNKLFTYYSGFAWTRMGDITSEGAWVRYLNEFVQRKHHPLLISIQK